MTSAITSPVTNGLFSGLTVAFSTGAEHKLEKGAVIEDATALRVIVSLSSSASVSTQIATLRRLLSGGASGGLGAQFKKVAEVWVSPFALLSIIKITAGYSDSRYRC